MKEVEQERNGRNNNHNCKGRLNPNRKQKYHIRWSLGNYKGSKKDACVSINSKIRGLKGRSLQSETFKCRIDKSCVISFLSRDYKVVCLFPFRPRQRKTE